MLEQLTLKEGRKCWRFADRASLYNLSN